MRSQLEAVQAVHALAEFVHRPASYELNRRVRFYISAILNQNETKWTEAYLGSWR